MDPILGVIVLVVVFGGLLAALVAVVLHAAHTPGGLITLAGAIVALGLIFGLAAGSAVPTVICYGLGFACLGALDRRKPKPPDATRGGAGE
jgi:hypothetical protein